MTENHQGIAVCRFCGHAEFHIRLFGNRSYAEVCCKCFTTWSPPDWCHVQEFQRPEPVPVALDAGIPVGPTEVDITELPPSPTPGIP
jgi:hypothetical protein